MRKFLTTALAAVTFGGAVAAMALPAEAGGYYRGGYYNHHHHSGNDAAVAAVAGIAGLALGAAITSNGNRSRGYSSGGYASGGYATYNSGYAYDPRSDGYSGDYYARPERICISRERVWDPYIERHVTIERRYPC